MKKIDKHSENKAMVGIIWALAWPTMLEQLMQTAVQYVDTAMVGVLGTQATAAVGATTTVNWLINSSISALSIGFLAFIAKAIGAKEQEKAKRAVAQAVLIVLLVGVFFTIVTVALHRQVPVWMQVDKNIQGMAAKYFLILYLSMLPKTASIILGTVLRAAGDTKTPMKVGILMNLTNVVLNFFFIYDTRTISVFGAHMWVPGAGLGVLGAAAASAIAVTVGGLCIAIILWRHPTVSPKGQKLLPDMQILKPCLAVALPNMLQRFGTSLGYVAFAAMINSLGEVSTAAHTIANTVESLFYIPGYGMQTAAATLAGNAYGAGDNTYMKRLAKMFIPLEVILMTVSGAALFVTAPALMGLFSKSPEVIRLGATVLRMVAVSEPFYGYSIIVEGFMMGVGKTKLPFIFNIIGMWGIRIVGTFICIEFFAMGLISAWACMIAHNLLLFVMFMVVHVRGTWNPLEDRRK